MDRTTLNIGPGILTFDSQVIYCKEDILVTPIFDTFKIQNSIHGDSDERFDNLAYEITYTPAGQWIAGHLPVLWPHTNPVVGSSIYGATDKNVVINGVSGQKVTFKTAAITNMPTLRLSSKESPIGQVTMIAIGANDTEWTDAAKRTITAAEAFSDTSWDEDDVKTVPYSAAWGVASPWADFDTEDGFTIDFELDLAEISTDAQGIVDRRIGSGITGVIARCVPQGITDAQHETLLGMQGAGVLRGASLGINSNDLVLDGGTNNPKITLTQAAPKAGPFRWGSTMVRSGEIAFVSVPKFTTGARNALFAVEVGA